MAITYSDPDVAADENIVQIAALTPTDNAVIIGNGTAWTTESGSTLRASLGLAIGSDVMAYDADLNDWAGVSPSNYLTTAAAAAAYQPLDADLTSWASVTRASGFDTFAATPTSANLRTLLSDESGSGVLLFAGGALGTPASGVLTNCTGLPNASVVGLGTAALVADNTLVHLAGTETITGQKAFSLTPTVVSDPVMTRGAAETITGLKTISVANLGLLLSHATNPYWQITNTTGSVQLFGQSLSTGARFGTLTNHNLEILTNSSTVATIYSGGGLVIGSPTGGNKGAGTLNATAVYDDNVLLSCYVLDAALDGTVDMEKWDANVPDREIPAVYRSETKTIDGKEVSEQTLLESAKTETRLHEPARKFTARLGTKYDPLTLEGYEAHWREKRHLTAFPNEAKFDPIKDAHSTGEWLQRLIENAEIQAVLIAKLHAKVAALEAAA